MLYENNDLTLRFLRHTETEKLYDFKPNYLTYLGIIVAIPRESKKILKLYNPREEEAEEDNNLIDRMIEHKQSTRMVYDRMIKEKSRIPTK